MTLIVYILQLFLSLGSFIRKFLDLFYFPKIKWNLIMDLFKAPISNKFQIIKDFITWFNSPSYDYYYYYYY